LKAPSVIPAVDSYAHHAPFYDLEHEDYQEDLAMYAGFAAGLGQSEALELAAGSGRIALPLASQGTNITGLDNSPAMLALAKEKAASAGLTKRARFVHGDMRAFDLGHTYGLVIIGLNSLMPLETQAEQVRALTCAARHLAPGGRLVVDLFNPDVALPDPHQEGQLFLHCLKVLPSGTHLLHFQSPRVDRATQRVSMTNYYDEMEPGGQVRRHFAGFSLRYVTAGEIELMLTQAGLRLEALYGSYELDPFHSDSPRLIAVASHA
jgi:SAM-dependent methyltransferase